MANRVSMDDTGLEISITLSASGGYAPDVMDDLCKQALSMFKDASCHKQALWLTVDSMDEAEAGDE